MNFFPCRKQRNSYMLLLSKTKAPLTKNKSKFKSFIIYWSLIWNNQDKFLKTSTSLNAFKHNMKS